jgi:hypothetical protein
MFKLAIPLVLPAQRGLLRWQKLNVQFVVPIPDRHRTNCEPLFYRLFWRLGRLAGFAARK